MKVDSCEMKDLTLFMFILLVGAYCTRTGNYKLIITPLDIAFMNAISTRRLKIGCIHSID